MLAALGVYGCVWGSPSPRQTCVRADPAQSVTMDHEGPRGPRSLRPLSQRTRATRQSTSTPGRRRCSVVARSSCVRVSSTFQLRRVRFLISRSSQAPTTMAPQSYCVLSLKLIGAFHCGTFAWVALRRGEHCVFCVFVTT